MNVATVRMTGYSELMTKTQTFPNTQPILTVLAATLDNDAFYAAYIALYEAGLLSAGDVHAARMLDTEFGVR